MRLIRIGRGDFNDRRFEDGTVSRRHAELVVLTDGRLYLSDCNSTAGTQVEINGEWQSIRQSFIDASSRVKFGDVVVSASQLK